MRAEAVTQEMKKRKSFWGVNLMFLENTQRDCVLPVCQMLARQILLFKVLAAKYLDCSLPQIFAKNATKGSPKKSS